MNLEQYRDEVKLMLTGGVLELEIDDNTLDKVILNAFREITRYIDTVRFKTIPFAQCIDLSEYDVSTVIKVLRTDGVTGTTSSQTGIVVDPIVVSSWQMTNGSYNLNGYNNYLSNYTAYLTQLQTRNTISTDMAFTYDKFTKKLYINVSSGAVENITIQYIPKFHDVNEIDSEFWIDMLIRLSVALTKVTLGNIRTRYTQSGALWTQDGETMRTEGNTELNEIRQFLTTNTQLAYGID